MTKNPGVLSAKNIVSQHDDSNNKNTELQGKLKEKGAQKRNKKCNDNRNKPRERMTKQLSTMVKFLTWFMHSPTKKKGGLNLVL